MSNTDHAEIEVDQKALDILSALSDLDGEANTRELRDFLGEMNKGPFHYRLNEYLEPQELVTTYLPDSEPGEFPAKVVTLTETGVEYIEQVDKDISSDDNVKQRVEYLEERIESFEKQIELIEKENKNIRERNKDLQVSQIQINTIAEKIDDIQEHPVISDDRSTEVVNRNYIIGETCKRILEQKIGESEFAQKQKNVRKNLDQNGSFVEEN